MFSWKNVLPNLVELARAALFGRRTNQIFLRHRAEAVSYLNKLNDLKTRQGAEIVVDNASVVSLLLSKAGFLVRDLGKVSV